MKREEALKIIKSILDEAVKKGSILGNIETAAAAYNAFTILAAEQEQ